MNFLSIVNSVCPPCATANPGYAHDFKLFFLSILLLACLSIRLAYVSGLIIPDQK